MCLDFIFTPVVVAFFVFYLKETTIKIKTSKRHPIKCSPERAGQLAKQRLSRVAADEKAEYGLCFMLQINLRSLGPGVGAGVLVWSKAVFGIWLGFDGGEEQKFERRD